MTCVRSVRSASRARLWLAAAALCCAPAQAADSGVLAVSAVVLSKSNCKLASGSMTLAFGTIQPTATSDASASATNSVTCVGSASTASFAISAGNGLHALGAGNRRMRHGTVTTEFLPYSLAISPSSATVPKGTPVSITITGTITPAEFQNVLAGAYADTVTITLSP